jgi:hypothetical protein
MRRHAKVKSTIISSLDKAGGEGDNQVKESFKSRSRRQRESQVKKNIKSK